MAATRHGILAFAEMAEIRRTACCPLGSECSPSASVTTRCCAATPRTHIFTRLKRCDLANSYFRAMRGWGGSMGNFNVKQKLGFLIFFSILMLVVVGLAGLTGAKRIESALTVMSEEKLPTANILSNIRTSMATLHGLCLEASL